MSFHKRLRRARKDKALSYQTIASACGVKWQTVQQWCKDESEGGTYPKIENLEPLAKILQTTPWYLLFGVEIGAATSDESGKPELSNEAEELIEQVVRLDKAGEAARKTFALHTGLLLLFPYIIESEDSNAGHPLLDEGESLAKDILARDKESGSRQDAGTTGHRGRHRALPAPPTDKRAK